MIKSKKVSIIGIDNMGSTIAYYLTMKGSCNTISLYDCPKGNCEYLANDLSVSSQFHGNHVKVLNGEHDSLNDSDIIIVNCNLVDTIEERLNYLDAKLHKQLNENFTGIIIVMGSPNDVMTAYVSARTGYDSQKIIGLGTSTTNNFIKHAIGHILNVDSEIIEAFSLGDPEDALIIPWSHVFVAGKNIFQVLEDNKDRFKGITVESIEESIMSELQSKINHNRDLTYTHSGSVLQVVETILNAQSRIYSINTCLTGEYGEEDVFCSVPAIIGDGGIEDIAIYHLDGIESDKFRGNLIKLRKRQKFINDQLDLIRVKEALKSQY